MAEALGLVASIIAVAQASEAVIKVCKAYIESVRNYPSDLRRVLLEVCSLKAIFDNLQFIHSNDLATSPILSDISSKTGPIEGCRCTMLELQGYFPTLHDKASSTPTRSRKGEHIKLTLDRLAWPSKGKKVHALLDELTRYKSTITTAFSAELVQDIKDLKNQVQNVGSNIDEIWKNSFRQWLWQTNPSSSHNDACSQHEPGTAQWVVKLPQWQEWLNEERRCLWIHGIPGAGKTVLFSQLVTAITSHCDAVRHRRIGNAYYYCYHARNQDETVPFLRWILGQLCRQAGQVPDKIYKNYQNGFDPTLPQLFTAMEDILQSFDVVFISLDAIDESQSRRSLLGVLHTLISNERFSKIQLLATSREYADIQNTMQSISTPISMANPGLRSDIERHVMRVLAEERWLTFWTSTLKEDVQIALVTGAQGMFRWVVCQIDLLRRMGFASEDDVRIALKTLPETLDETYERIFSSIQWEYRTLVRSALRWLAFHGQTNLAPERLSLSVLTELVFPSSETTASRHATSTVKAELLQDICGCLMRVKEGEDGPVSFAHYTVREFITSSRSIHGCASYFSLQMPGLLQDHFAIIFKQIPEKLAAYHNSADTLDQAQRYCEDSAIDICGSLVQWETTMIDDSSLRSIVFNFIRAGNLSKVASSCVTHHHHTPKKRILGTKEYVSVFDFHPSYRDELENTDIHREILLYANLLVLGGYRLAKALLATVSMSGMYRQSILFNMRIWTECGWCHVPTLASPATELKLEGSLVDVIAQVACITSYQTHCETLRIALAQGAGYFDPSRSLVIMYENHFGSESDNSSTGILDLSQHFVSHGADLGFDERPLTLLQLAVANTDTRVTRLLLKYGADPNRVGKAKVHTYSMERLRQLGRFQGQSPLGICQALMRDEHRNQDSSDEALGVISELLRRHGGREFTED
ncbi:hypothetical protein BKA56DRAFT_618144 [Ilyonectria sp. MPI-CAGE-AT-0026]|nr:hypothetical protein BKA56DRAFT_618144 [Ilyonectria sp. MPI-CAGE-AT-0026]